MRKLLHIPLLLVSVFHFGPLHADDVPVAPIPLKTRTQGTRVYELSNRLIKVSVSPEEAAVISMEHPPGKEWLMAPLRITPAAPAATSAPWEHRAWKTSEGRQVVMLTKSMGPPLRLRVVHLIELIPGAPSLRQTTRILATGPGQQALLAPELTLGLPVPEERVEISPAHRVLHYKDFTCHWNVTWQLEMPASAVAGESQEEVADNLLTLSSKPGLLPGLPPQGWTLSCELLLSWEEK